MEDRCVMCGEIIPEGRMVCPICESNILNGENPKRDSLESAENNDDVNVGEVQRNM